MTSEQQQAVRKIAQAVVLATMEAGTFGAPGGVIYAALMAQGCTFQQFTSLMGSIERAGFITRSGDCYRPTESGRQFARMS